MTTYLTGFGFSLLGIIQGFTHSETGRVLQVDGIFHRERGTSVL